MSKVFHVVDSTVRAQTVGNDYFDVLFNAGSSVTAVVNKSTGIASDLRYKPYGAILSGSTISPEENRWNAGNDLQQTSLVNAEYYSVPQGAFYSSQSGRTLEPCHQACQSHGNSYRLGINMFAGSMSSYQVSPGVPQVSDFCSKIINENVTKEINDCIKKFCNALSDPKLREIIRKCMKLHGIEKSFTMNCLDKWCKSGKDIICSRGNKCKPTVPYRCRIINDCGKPEEKTVLMPFGAMSAECPTEGDAVGGTIRICDEWYRDDRECPTIYSDNPAGSILHEIMHICGPCHGLDDEGHQDVFDGAAECVARAIGCKRGFGG